ncbi:MAG TPA: NADP-dependent oxidoreductase [Pseudomonadales bacterium]|nr:NADP-dependent oxidoreductase [Pseudomonadales bacterium]
MTDINHQWILARTPPEGWPTEADFAWREAAPADPGPGQALSRTLYLSLDPYQWGRRRSGTEKPGEVCHGRTVSQVLKSRHEEFAEGDFIFNTNGWQEYGLTGEGVSVFNYMFPRRLDPDLAPISTAVGVLGMLGLTAYSGMVVQCDPQPGETVVVSAASGGVGQIAGQIAKIHGCRVIGIAGIREKCDFIVNELGFDAAVSHLSDSMAEDLAAACPDGIDVYFENVGGKVFEAVAPLLAHNARIALCGMISQYGNTSGEDSRAAWQRVGKPWFDRQAVTVHNLFVGNFVADYQDKFLEEMADWIKAGKVIYREDLWPGLGNAPTAFAAMLKGGNFGKTLVGVSDDPTLSKQRHRGGSNVIDGQGDS